MLVQPTVLSPGAASQQMTTPVPLRSDLRAGQHTIYPVRLAARRPGFDSPWVTNSGGKGDHRPR